MKWIKSIMVAGTLFLFANGSAHAQTSPGAVRRTSGRSVPAW